MSERIAPVPYRKWFESEAGASLRWLFATQSSLAYFLRNKKGQLIEEGLIEVIPTRGYFINPVRFTEESVKRYFVLGS